MKVRVILPFATQCHGHKNAKIKNVCSPFWRDDGHRSGMSKFRMTLFRWRSWMIRRMSRRNFKTFGWWIPIPTVSERHKPSYHPNDLIGSSICRDVRDSHGAPCTSPTVRKRPLGFPGRMVLDDVINLRITCV